MALSEEKQLEEIKLYLDDILTQVAKSQNIQHFKLNPNTNANYGDGFLTQFFTGEIINKDTDEITSVAIKKSTEYPDFDYGVIFSNEDIFYKTIFPTLDKVQRACNVSKPFDNIPKYFCGSAESKKEFIAMENVKPLGYLMFDKKQYFDREYLKFIFQVYAKFHALSFVLRKTDPGKYQNIIKDITSNLAELLSKPVAAAVSATINNLNTEENKIVYEALKDLDKTVSETFLKAYAYNGDFRCIVHGDCWSNNMLFKYSESGKLLDMKLIDFQFIHDDTPIHDLSYFFYSGASKKDFDNIEYYLQIYYETFKEFAEKLDYDDEIFSFENLVNDWKDNAIFGVMLGIWLWQIKLMPKEEIVDFINKHKDLSKEEQQKVGEKFLDEMYKSDLFKERTTPILIHAYEYGILTQDKIVKE